MLYSGNTVPRLAGVGSQTASKKAWLNERSLRTNHLAPWQKREDSLSLFRFDPAGYLLKTPSPDDSITGRSRYQRDVPESLPPFRRNLLCVVQYPQRLVFVSSPRQADLEGMCRSGQRTSSKTASFSPKGGTTKSTSSLCRRPSIYSQRPLQRDG